MELNDLLRAYAREHLGCEADADDDTIKAAIEAALKDGKMEPAKFAELLSTKDDKADQLKTLVAGAVGDAMKPVAESMGQLAAALATSQKATDPPAPTPPAAPNPPAAPVDEDAVRSMVTAELAKAQAAGGIPANTKAMFASVTNEPRVKEAVEQYDNTKTALIYPQKNDGGRPHPFAGEPVAWMGRTLDAVTKQDHALIGAFVKFRVMALAEGPEAAWSRMNDHEKGLFRFVLHKCDWQGTMANANDGEEFQGKLTPAMQKAVIDDTTSGGSYMVPDVFDATVIQTPLLHSELFPLVTVKPLARGSSVDGFSTGHVTITSNHTEGVAASLESTSGLITNLDTTIFPCVGAIEIGLDFESDTPVNIGQVITMDYGQKLLEWLDEQIAIGDGTTEPEGIFTKSGTNSVTHGATGTAFGVADFEKLMFGVNKATRNSKGGRCVFITNDRMYRRAKSTPVGTADARRVLGMDYRAYMLADHSVKIQESISNGSIAYANMGWYTMYRRLGIQLRLVTEGQNLALKNTRLVVMRARYGGQLSLASACAVMTDGPMTG
jgi:HK97 family phage major capsid protein